MDDENERSLPEAQSLGVLIQYWVRSLLRASVYMVFLCVYTGFSKNLAATQWCMLALMPDSH